MTPTLSRKWGGNRRRGGAELSRTEGSRQARHGVEVLGRDQMSAQRLGRLVSAGSPSPTSSAGPIGDAPREARNGWLFVSPWLIGMLVFTVGPIIASAVISTTEWNLLDPPVFVGLDNYARLASDPDFLNSVQVTVAYVLIGVPVFQLAGLALSLFLNLKLAGMRLFRTVMFLPAVLEWGGCGRALDAAAQRQRGGQPGASLHGHLAPTGWLTSPAGRSRPSSSSASGGSGLERSCTSPACRTFRRTSMNKRRSTEPDRSLLLLCHPPPSHADFALHPADRDHRCVPGVRPRIHPRRAARWRGRIALVLSPLCVE